MNNLKSIRLSELKTQAVFLLKDFQSNSAKAIVAASRFTKIQPFQNTAPEVLLQSPETVKLKHAYAVLAFEYGFSAWTQLKEAVIENDCLYRYSCVAFVHSWFKDYNEARRYFEKNGGYLISFWKDYAVCGPEYISCIGLGSHEDLWKKIGYNWVQPKDTEAYSKLKSLARENYLLQL
jgi:hypothetical protein